MVLGLLRDGSRKLVWLAGAVLAVVVVAGCSAGARDVSTLTDQAVSPASDGFDAVAQAASAQSLADCLGEQGIRSDRAEMEFVDPDNGQNVSFVSVMPEPVNESHYLVSGPDPRGGMAGDHSQQALAAADAGEPVFVDGGQDYSAQYAECLSSSGYYVPSSHTDPAQEAVDKQAIAAESNRWAQCARDHGYPSVKDATVVVDNWATSPEVVMPGSVTADQLQTLLEFCPYASTEYVDGPLPEPGDPAWQAAVVFDLPPGDPKQAELYSVMMQNRLSFIPEG